MEIKGDTAIYSRLQEITKFMEYLKQNVSELHLQMYYMSNITPRIAVNNFKHAPQLLDYLTEYEKRKTILTGSGEQEEKRMAEQLDFAKKAGIYNIGISELEKVLKNMAELRQEGSTYTKKYKAGTNIIRQVAEKGYGIALLWTLSTQISICSEDSFVKTLSDVESELNNIYRQKVKSRAYQQSLWIEELKEPFYVFYAEACGLFHPALRKVYDDIPILKDFARKIEDWVNARPASPIHLAGYSEDPSTAVAEAVATFYRQVPKITESPEKLKDLITFEKCTRPIFFGFLAYQHEEKFELTNYPFIIDIDDLCRHTLITGSTGGGKTRVAQIIVESTSLYVPTIVIDPVGELTGMIKSNEAVSKEKEYGLPRGVAYDFAKIYTLDDKGIKFEVNILEKPDVPDERLVEVADHTSLSLCELIDESRLREDFRNVILNAWRNNIDLDFDSFIEAARERSGEKRIGEKLERLYSYRYLMTKSSFTIETLMVDKLSIFDLSSREFSDEVKLMVSRFILRELTNYSMDQPHSDTLNVLVLVDEVHRYYEPGKPKTPALALEALVKEGRGKGVGVVMVTQAIKDLGDLLTQANLRIMLKIMESEVQHYYTLIGDSSKARGLYALEPRIGYILYRGKGFFCKFRPTLSMPKGLEDFQDLKRHALPTVMIEKFKEIVYSKPLKEELKEELSPDHIQILLIIAEFGGKIRSKKKIVDKFGRGRETTLKIIDYLSYNGFVNEKEIGNRKEITLNDKGRQFLNNLNKEEI